MPITKICGLSLIDTNTREIELVQKMRKGDSNAFEDLYDLYSVKLYRFVNSYLGIKADSEEIVQDVFCGLWDHKSELKSVSAFRSYLYTIAFNRVKNFFAKKRVEERHKQKIAVEFILQNEQEAQEVDYDKVMSHVDQLIDSLAPRQREVFLLSRKEGLSIDEIASYLNISPSTVKNQIHSAISNIKEKAMKSGMVEFLFFLLFYH